MNPKAKEERDAATKPIAGSPGADPPPTPPVSWMLLLRLLLVLDALVLFALGAVFIFAPQQVQLAFHFSDLPVVVNYIIGLWGCGLLTMSLGYAVAATNPIRHLVWVQVAIARGALECLLGIVYLARGVVTWQQAVFGIVVAALMTVAYIAVYPRKRRDIRTVAKPAAAPNPTADEKR